MILTVTVVFGDKARNRSTRCNGRTGGEGWTVSRISKVSLDNHYLDAAILLLVRGGLDRRAVVADQQVKVLEPLDDDECRGIVR